MTESMKEKQVHGGALLLETCVGTDLKINNNMHLYHELCDIVNLKAFSSRCPKLGKLQKNLFEALKKIFQKICGHKARGGGGKCH